MGALNSKVHLEKVEKYGHLAKEEGGTIHCGFGVTKLDVGEDFKNGYYFPPTIVTGLTNKSRYVCMQGQLQIWTGHCVHTDQNLKPVEISKNLLSTI